MTWDSSMHYSAFMRPFWQHLSRDLGRLSPVRFEGMGYRETRRGVFWIIPPNKRRSSELSFIHNHDPVRISVDGESMHVSADTLYIWDLTHRVDYGEAGSRWTVSWLQAWGRGVTSALIRHGVPMNTPIQFPTDDAFVRWAGLVRDEFDAYVSPSPQVLLHMVEGFILECRRQLRDKEREVVPEVFREAKQTVEARQRERVTLPELAERARMSRAHFSRGFKKHYGMSPIDYLIHVRIHTAAELLQNPHTTVQEAAAAVGYDDVFHFSKLFKKHVGVAPAHYRDSKRS